MRTLIYSSPLSDVSNYSSSGTSVNTAATTRTCVDEACSDSMFSRKTQYFSSYKPQWRLNDKQRCKLSSQYCRSKLLDTTMLVLAVLS
jgi:hypothetical protein